MADEVKAKRPVPPQFLKKKKEKEDAAKLLAESPQDSLVENTIVEKVAPAEIDMSGLIKDLMFNRYFHIFEKEARPIAEKMVSEGSSSLHNVKWFLASSERIQLAKELKEKYGLS